VKIEEREEAALAALRRLHRRSAEAFQRVFIEVCQNARSSARTPAERNVWGDIEESIRIDLRSKP
jgi:hypothetical protein